MKHTHHEEISDKRLIILTTVLTSLTITLLIDLFMYGLPSFAAVAPSSGNTPQTIQSSNQVNIGDSGTCSFSTQQTRYPTYDRGTRKWVERTCTNDFYAQLERGLGIKVENCLRSAQVSCESSHGVFSSTSNPNEENEVNPAPADKYHPTLKDHICKAKVSADWTCAELLPTPTPIETNGQLGNPGYGLNIGGGEGAPTPSNSY